MKRVTANYNELYNFDICSLFSSIRYVESNYHNLLLIFVKLCRFDYNMNGDTHRELTKLLFPHMSGNPEQFIILDTGFCSKREKKLPVEARTTNARRSFESPLYKEYCLRCH